MPNLRVLFSGLIFLGLAAADVRQCGCDVEKPESLASRECGLCREAEKQPPEQKIFILKDINPRKPNRWLVLPRAHTKGGHSLGDLSAADRLALWKAAIAKGRELFGDEWGIAYNGDESRTQCHGHVHVGKLLQGVELSNFKVVNGPETIPVPSDGHGLWIHPDGKKLHVHLGEEITETVLLR
jgi:hypothetical protein